MRKLLIFLLAVPLWATTYCVDASRPDDTGNGTTTCKKYINSAVALARAAPGPHTINIAAGTYSNNLDRIYLDDVDLNGLTVIGAGRGNTTISTPAAAGYNPIWLVAGPTGTMSFQDFTVVANGANYGILAGSAANAGAVLNVTRVDARSDATHTQHLILINGATANLASVGMYSRRITDKYPFYTAGSASANLNYCLSQAISGANTVSEWFLNSSGTVNVNNCVVMDAGGSAIVQAAGTANLRNSIVHGGITNNASYPINKTGGTLNTYNNFLIGNPWDGTAKFINGANVDSGNVKTNAPLGIGGYAKRGFILPRIDDTGNASVAQTVAGLLAAKGFTGTFFTEVSTSANQTAAIRSLVSGGTMEVGVHSYSHSNLSYLNAIRVTYAGAQTNPTVALAAGVIQLRTTEGGDNVDIDTTTAAKDTIGEIAGTYGNWTLAKSTTGGQDATYIYAAGKATSLKAQVATAAPCDILFDRTASGYFKDEITDPKASLAALVNGAGNITDPQTGATYVARSFGFPYNANATDTRTATIAAGYSGAGSNKIGGTLGVGDITFASSVDLYQIWPIGGSTYISAAGNEANVRLRARALAHLAAQTGAAISVLSHSFGSEMTENDWTWAIDEWSKFGDSIRVMSHQKFADHVRAGLWTNNGDGTFSRTFPAYTDWRLVVGSSPLLNAGTDAGLTTDFLGNPIVGNPDIGAYEYRNPPRMRIVQ